jgi:5,10-methylenetetrahydromethanopterin reductase
VPFSEIEPINEAFARGDVTEALRRTPDDLADRFCIAGTPEEVAARVRAEILPTGFGHVALALADAEIPRVWAGIDIPGLPTLSQQVQLIADRVLPLLAA